MTDRLGHASRLWALDSATFTVDAGMLIHGGSGTVTIPMPAYLIEHPEGLLLFDTGLNPLAAEDPEALFGPMASLLGLSYTRDQGVDRQIEALGYRQADIAHLVASHAHFDHSGGFALFPDATRWIGAGELAFVDAAPEHLRPFYLDADLGPARQRPWTEVGADHDVFGDGSVVILWTPGHTPGELSLLVRLPDRNFVLVGDSVHLRAGIEQELTSPLDVDADLALGSIRRIKRAAAEADATIWITHDPEDWAAYGHAPTCWT